MESLALVRSSLNERLSYYEPLVILLTPFLASLLVFVVAPSLATVVTELQHKGWRAICLPWMMAILQMLPGVKSKIKKQKEEVVNKMRSGGKKSGRESWRSELPDKGLGIEVVDILKLEKLKDAAWQGRSSGAVYLGGDETKGHFNTLNAAYSMFAHTNPLHPDLFPSIAKFEAEAVAMTASLLGAKDSSLKNQVCGNMTSGGTESILMAVKSTRDYMRATKGITKPEMVIPESAHSAYDKAAQYFNIKLWRASVDKNFQADMKSIKRLINRNTIMIVGSAPGFPHGIIDPIEELGALALSKRICFHVDLCLGGFVLPFAQKLGYSVPAFDFSVPGVTSISVDIHKYGLGPKGTSVVLYRSHEIRQHQFVAVTEWSGGLYISPSMAGSRPGALIAGAWASLMSFGMDGYMEAVQKVMEASEKLKKGISEMVDLYIIGKPHMTIVAFASRTVDIYKVNDAMTAKGWSLNALHKPNSLHICITLQHVEMIEEFLKDLALAVRTVKENPGSFEDGMAPIYGAAAKMPDRGIVKDLLVAYMDNTC
ncbi:hypothetical protein GOP47_0006029 [Adiantum capillus-veneris]|uniref:sphinganine-1-phosphate aldolase n=1 Tax=Adiantum capillus-veneris TaxID=13818 RepID=A0A9D4V2A7_ADICA|nr:hypothetical protein GOP47_0006029 [Adiantum capillus-veneris]